MGTCTHFVVENYVLTGIIPTEFQYPKEKIAVKFINDFLITGRLIPVFVEYIVYNDHIAGQIDFVCRDEKGNWYILDFKTNEKISKDTYGKSLHGVLSFLGDASFYHYSLQLSIYKDLIKRFNINISKLYIVHIQENDYKFIPCVDVTQVISLDKIIEGSLIL
jgi:ATP-dependent exoDNAse (exonuclease V) beta subunit